MKCNFQSFIRHTSQNKTDNSSTKAADRKRQRLDFSPQHESFFTRSTVHMTSAEIRMCLSRCILIVMTHKMPGITQGRVIGTGENVARLLTTGQSFALTKMKPRARGLHVGQVTPVSRVFKTSTGKAKKKKCKEQEFVPHAQHTHTHTNKNTPLGCLGTVKENLTTSTRARTLKSS